MRIDLSVQSKHWRFMALAATIVATGAIVSTYSVFNNMYDEPAHIAAGMEWLSRGTYTLDPQHPPLSRVASALLPWLSGERSTGDTRMFSEGRAILGRGEHYVRTLALARLGQVPFFLVLAFVTWYWTRRLASERAAAFAVGFVVTNPNILAHAGVAGTDIGPAALMPAALLTWTLWLDRPDAKRSVAFGLALALCGLTKFSAGAYWVPAAIAVALFHAMQRHDTTLWAGLRRRFRPSVIAFMTACVVTWAMYRFDVGPVGRFTVPAPEFWTGLAEFFRRGARGHPSFLLGEVRSSGWWYSDLVTMLVKTPIPLLLFSAVGSWVAVAEVRQLRRAAATKDPQQPDWRFTMLAAPVIGVTSVLLVASATPVDLGVRLALPMHPMLAILAALGLSAALARAKQMVPRAGLALIGTWAVAVPMVAHPDHIAYFNAIAGRDPSRILVESNLDWGQDLFRLRDAMKELRMDSLRVHYFGTAEFRAVGLERAWRLAPDERTTGWVAASETFYAGVWSDTSLAWLHAFEPVRRVGKSMRLYYIKPAP